MAQYYITAEHYVNNSNDNKGETNKKTYTSFKEATFDFTTRIFKLNTDEIDDYVEAWDIRLYGKTENLEDLLVYYTTEEEKLALYKENWGHFREVNSYFEK